MVLRPKGRLASLDNSIAAVQTLLESIRFVYCCCMQSIEIDAQTPSTQTILTKWAFDEVRSRYVDDSIQFRTYPSCTEKEFDISVLMKLPVEMRIVRYDTFKSGLIDFDDVFQKSLLLHDSVLQPFMAHFKCHLNSVQTCLTSIDEWLNETETNFFFLESTFGQGSVKAGLRQKKKNPICRNCGYCFKEHNASRYHKNTYRQCPEGNHYYKRSDAMLIKEFVTSCQVNDSFDLFNEADKDRLLRLVKFVSSL